MPEHHLRLPGDGPETEHARTDPRGGPRAADEHHVGFSEYPSLQPSVVHTHQRVVVDLEKARILGRWAVAQAENRIGALQPLAQSLPVVQSAFRAVGGHQTAQRSARKLVHSTGRCTVQHTVWRWESSHHRVECFNRQLAPLVRTRLIRPAAGPKCASYLDAAG